MVILALALAGCIPEDDILALYDKDDDGFLHPSAEEGQGAKGPFDCDDADAAIHPDAVEVCDGLDNDCSGTPDDGAGAPSTFFVDQDGDSWGTSATVTACAAGAAMATRSGDCDDAASASNPDAIEIAYNGADDDCVDGDLTDVDGDGYDGGESGDDCNDDDGSVNPGVADIPYNGTDEDCSGEDLLDADGDGHDAESAGGDDCDDTDATINPDADPEDWDRGYTDVDCSGYLGLATGSFGDLKFVGEVAGARAGWALYPAQNFEGGRGAFLVSAPNQDTDVELGGRVYLVTNSTGGSLSTYGYVDNLGDLPVTIDDVDGDGIEEVGGDPSDRLWGSRYHIKYSTGEIGSIGCYGGFSAAAVGEFDGDGNPDLALACPTVSAATMGVVGYLDVETIAASGLTTFPDAATASWTGTVTDQYLGRDLESLGDANGDGLDDLVMSSDVGETTAFVVHGGTSSGTIDSAVYGRLFYSASVMARPTFDVVGDTMGDGVRDLVVLTDTGAQFFDDDRLRGMFQLGTSKYRVDADGTPFDRAVSLGDLDGDALEETALLIESSASAGTGWLGLVDGQDVAGVATSTSAADLRLQATSSSPGSLFGASAVLAGDLDRDGRAWLALGGWADAELGAETGAVALLRLPE